MFISEISGGELLKRCFSKLCNIHSKTRVVESLFNEACVTIYERCRL